MPFGPPGRRTYVQRNALLDGRCSEPPAASPGRGVPILVFVGPETSSRSGVLRAAATVADAAVITGGRMMCRTPWTR